MNNELHSRRTVPTTAAGTVNGVLGLDEQSMQSFHHDDIPESQPILENPTIDSQPYEKREKRSAGTTAHGPLPEWPFVC